jgi:spore coat polysaccharide biosynthesis protein SpsF
MENKTAVIIQARMGSTRLPGKVLIDVINRHRDCSYKYIDSTLDIIIQRLMHSVVDDIIVATTTKKEDDAIIELCKNINNLKALENREIKYYRGDEDNVIKRVYDSAKEFNISTIAEVTADCPFIDYRHINYMLGIYFNRDSIIKRNHILNYSMDGWPDGFDTQVYSTNLLHEAMKSITNKTHKGHAGWNITEYLNCNSLCCIPPEKYEGLRKIGLTLDTPEDLKLIRKIFRHFKRIDMSAEEIIDYVLENPTLLEINKNVKRKVPGKG